MFIIENKKITGSKNLEIGKSRLFDILLKFSNTTFSDDDIFLLTLDGKDSTLYGFMEKGCLRFTRVDFSWIKSKNTTAEISVKCNGSEILSDSITITAVVQGGGEEIQGIVFEKQSYKATSVKIIPENLTADWTDFSNMFYYCTNLTSIPALDTSKGTNFQRMFNGCGALTTIPALNTSKGTNFEDMFASCDHLTSIPALNTANGTNFYSMFDYCIRLTTIPVLNVSNGTNFSYMFDYCRALTDFGGLLNVKKSYSLSSCTKLTHDSLLNVLNGLADLTGGTAQTLTLGSTNLAKLTDAEKAIATNKNWTLA